MTTFYNNTFHFTNIQKMILLWNLTSTANDLIVSNLQEYRPHPKPHPKPGTSNGWTCLFPTVSKECKHLPNVSNNATTCLMRLCEQ